VLRVSRDLVQPMLFHLPNDTCMCIVCLVMMNICNLGVGFSSFSFVDQLCFLQTEETLVPFCR